MPDLRGRRLAAARKLGTHMREQWDAIIDEVDGLCVRCGATDRPLFKDHVVGLARGGSDAIDNLQPICRRCNSTKEACIPPDCVNWLHRWRDAGRPRNWLGAGPEAPETPLPDALWKALAAKPRALAEQLGCLPNFIHAVLAGRRRPPDAMLAAVGWRRTVSYEPIPTEGDWWPSLTATEP